MEVLLQKLMLLRHEAENKAEYLVKARRRALAAVSLILGILAACIVGFFIFSSFSDPQVQNVNEMEETPKPELYICSGDTAEPALENLKRNKRQRSNSGLNTLIKRIARPLSLPPPPVGLNFTYNPPLYHDVGARCAWGHITNKRVPHLEDIGVAYDFQQLEARQCDDPEDCKSLCLRMHKTDDPYLCNYFTWHRQKKLALFYFLEPTLKWNLTDDNRVETFFWQCKETQCAWWWRPHRVWTHLSESTPSQLRKEKNLITVHQCVDFASCQFSCETRPTFKELGLGQQVHENANPDDPTCSYVMMPSKGNPNRQSFLFTMPQTDLRNMSYRGSPFYDSFELICHEQETTTTPSISVSTPPASQPAKPKSSNATETKRQKRDIPNNRSIKLRECRSKGREIDCDHIRSSKSDQSECMRVNMDSIVDSGTSVSIESKRPVWLVLQHASTSDDAEQSVQLTPGLKHTVEVVAEKLDRQMGVSKKCGPIRMRHRRCTNICNDRLAVESCGCTLTPDPDPESSVNLLSIPVCDDQRLRTCIQPHFEKASDSYFQCMKECKAQCNVNQPFTLKSKSFSSVDTWANDVIDLNLSFSDAAHKSAAIDSRPINADTDTHHFVYVWIPIMVIGVVLLALILCYCAKCLM